MESVIFASGSRKKRSKEILHIHLSIVMCNIFDTWDFMRFWSLCIISGIFFHHCSCTRAQKLGFLICESISKRTKPEQQGEIKLHPIADLLDLRQPIKVNSQIHVSSCAENTDTHWQLITFTISINYEVCSGNELQKRAPDTVSTRMFVEVIEGGKRLGG